MRMIVTASAPHRRQSRPALERFLAKVQVGDSPEACWIWTGARHSAGYGSFRYDGRSGYAHRWSYEHFVGKVPEGLQLDHLCRVRLCVNAAHLEPVTRDENLRRGIHHLGTDRSNAVLTEADVRFIREAWARGIGIAVLRKVFPVSVAHISRIARGEEWRHIA